jgi:AGZA family xanthine/uracil permease-like MFS transporter
VAPFIRRITPRAALLGTLAGVSIAFISMRPATEIFMTSIIGLVCLGIILVSWFGGVRYPRNLPAGLVAIVVGMAIAWGATALGFPEVGGMSAAALGEAVASFGFPVPLPAVDHVFSGFEFLGFILVTAIPFGVYDLVEAMDNVESAEAAGDSYSTTEAISAEGTITLVGTLLGSPFANAVYIGHPGWKSMGGRIGYSAATGVFVLAITWLGIIAVFLNLVPVVAIAPILLYIGMLIGAQAFQTTPMSHAPAIVLGLVPHLAAWAKTLIDGALGAANVEVTPELIEGMAEGGVLYEGLAVLGNGAILTGLVLAAIGVFIIERKLDLAAAFAGAGAVLTFFGFMHGDAVGIAVSPLLAVAYAVLGGFLYALARLEAGREGAGAPTPMAAE